MTAADKQQVRNRRGKRALALVEAPAADATSATDASPMAVSIAGVSTACSTDALASSAEAVRRTLDD